MRSMNEMACGSLAALYAPHLQRSNSTSQSNPIATQRDTINEQFQRVKIQYRMGRLGGFVRAWSMVGAQTQVSGLNQTDRCLA
jgi:hypothetical protein